MLTSKCSSNSGKLLLPCLPDLGKLNHSEFIGRTLREAAAVGAAEAEARDGEAEMQGERSLCRQSPQHPPQAVSEVSSSSVVPASVNTPCSVFQQSPFLKIMRLFKR